MCVVRGLAASGLLLMLVTLPVSAEKGPESPATAATDAQESTVALGVEGITRHTGDDDPGVLYILPWQPPTLPRRSRAELDAGSDELLTPKDPLTLERHRMFRETLNPSMDSTLSLQ